MVRRGVEIAKLIQNFYLPQPQPPLAKLVPRVKYNVKPKHRLLSNPEGPLGRIKKIKKAVSALFKYERIELHIYRSDEVRGYAERLISEALRHGDCHRATMELADFWLEDKQMIHKLFKVLVPRYQDCHLSYTVMHLLPDKCHIAATGKEHYFLPETVLELRGNPYPPMPSKPKANSQSLTNILLREARKEFQERKKNQPKVETF